MTQRREATPASVPAVRRGDALDVAMLPTYGFGYRSLMWWGTAGMIVIEGVAFAFMIIVYFYLRSLALTWPTTNAAPNLLWGTVNLVLIIASALPNVWTDKAAIDHDLRKVRIGLVLCSTFVRWDDSAYGSVLWMMLGLHTFNLVTDVGDTLVLTALMFKRRIEGKRFVDVAENSGYWDFIVLSWVPIYAVIYWAPRF